MPLKHYIVLEVQTMSNPEYFRKYREEHKDELIEYGRRYYEQNKDAFREQGKQYRQENREVLAARKKEYYSKPENKQRKAERNKALYQLKATTIKARQKERRFERKSILDEIALQYSCQNPDCKWVGNFDPCQLTFHHVDPSQKEIEVAKMHSWSYKSIVAEVNKCVILCRNCHPLADRGEMMIEEHMICKIAGDKATNIELTKKADGTYSTFILYDGMAKDASEINSIDDLELGSELYTERGEIDDVVDRLSKQHPTAKIEVK